MKTLFIAMLVAVCLGMTAYAQDEVIIVSGHAEAIPFTWVKENKMVGMTVELCNKIFAGMGIQVKYEIRPWKRALNETKKGEIDMLLALYMTEERKKDFEYTIPYSQEPVSVFVNKNKSFALAKWDDLIGRTGCTPLGESLGQELDQFIKEKLTIQRADTLNECLPMLEKGRFDYVIFSKYHVQMELRKMNLLDKIEVLPYNMTSEEVYMAFSKKSDFVKLVPKVNSEITRLIQDGTVEKLLDNALVDAAND